MAAGDGRSDRGRWARIAVPVQLLVLACLSGCEIRTGSGPGPQHPPAAAPPAGEQSGQPAAASGPADERTATHASVAAQVAVVRGLTKAIGVALTERTLGLSPRAARAHGQASPQARQAHRELNAGRQRLARSQAMQALRMAAPAVDELSGKASLPPSVRQQFAEQAAVCRDAVARAIAAVRNTGNSAGLSHFEQASSLLGEVARPSGSGRPPARSMGQAAAELDRGIGTRWPEL